MSSEYFPSFALTSQTKPGPNIEDAVTMNSRCRFSMEENEGSRASLTLVGTGPGLGVRASKKK